MTKSEIRAVVILGSVRQGSYTEMASRVVLDELRGDDSVSVDVVDPAALDLTLPGAAGGSGVASELQERVATATGVIFVTPEYHGSYSSVTKLIIDSLGFPSVLSGKPVALVGVASGSIGAIKALEHLRSVCSHVGAIVLPGPVSVPDVRTCFDEHGRCVDTAVESRLRGAATRLLDYIRDNICPRITLESMARERDGS